MNKGGLFQVFLAAFLVAIFLVNIFLTMGIALWLCLFGGIILLVCRVYGKVSYSIGIFFLLGSLLGLFRGDIFMADMGEKEALLAPYFLQSRVEVSFRVTDVMSRASDRIQYRGEVLSVGGEEVGKKVFGIFFFPGNFEFIVGEEKVVQAKMYPIRQDSYGKYLRASGIYFKMYPYITESGANNSDSVAGISSWLFLLRERLLEKIYQLYPRDEGIFLGGILFGARESISPELKENFNRSGLTHFIAVSGYNVTIIIIFLGFFIRFLPPLIRTVVIGVFLLLFTLFVGPTASVVRASLMGALGYMILYHFGRGKDLFTLVLFVAAIMVYVSPYSLNYDISFHLSFLAVLGIFSLSDPLKRVFFFLPEKFAIRESVVLTFSALIFTLPIMLLNFGTFSVVSPLSNVLMAPAIPLAMFLGFLSVSLSFVSSFLAELVGYFAYAVLKYCISLVHFFGELSWSSLAVDLGEYALYFQVLYFLGLGFLVALFRIWAKQKEAA